MTDLAAHSTIYLGGPAEEFVEADTELDLVSLVRGSADDDLFVLGGGSNVLIADSGVSGLTVKVMTRGIERIRHGQDHQVLRVSAGESWDELVAVAVEDGLAGIECLAGIPGTVGATPIQNVGAYGQEIAKTVVAVEVFDRSREELTRLTRKQCRFGYRTSVFKTEPGRFVAIAVEIKLKRSKLSEPIRNRELAAQLGVARGERVALTAAREAVLSLREEKGMVIDPDDSDTNSLGSFFTNPSFEPSQLTAVQERVTSASGSPAPTLAGRSKAEDVRIPAAWLIERAGFSKGHGGRRGIGISQKHVLALVNRGGGSTADAVELAGKIALRVWEVFGVSLWPEPDFVGHTWTSPAPSERH